MAGALSVEHLAISIRGREVVSDISFELPEGGCIGIAGETGSGKTVACRALTGTLGRIGGVVTRGSARFGDVDLGAAREADWSKLRGREVALIPQSSLSSLDPLMRAGDQLVETVRHLDGRTGARSRALELIESVQLSDPERVFRCYPHQLSGGMRQRIMIALAIAGRPRLLVADEATTALDVTVQRGILELLMRLRQETGMSLVLVTHDLAVVEETSDRAAIVYAGVTVETGPTEAVIGNPTHPYTKALLSARPASVLYGEPLVGIPGTPPAVGEFPEGCRFAPRCRFCRPACEAAPPPLQTVASEQACACIRWKEAARESADLDRV